jgi:TolB-like protein
VLYFENQSGAKEDEHFRDGITEDIVTEVSKIKQLEIFPRSEMLAFRDKPVTALQVGQQLGAAYVLGRFNPPRQQPRADNRAARRGLHAAFRLG